MEQVYHRNDSDQARRRTEEGRLLKLREAAIRRQTGSESVHVKRAVDCRRRAHIRQQTFYYGPIKDTPYALLLALPGSYGANRVEARLDLTKQSAASLVEAGAFDMWTLHPDYKYCEASGARQNASSVAVVLDVLEWAFAGGASPKSGSQQLPAEPLAGVSFEQLGNLNDATLNRPPNTIVCDRDLFGSLLFDAAATYEKSDSYCGSASVDAGCDKQSSFSFYASAQSEDTCARTPAEMR